MKRHKEKLHDHPSSIFIKEKNIDLDNPCNSKNKEEKDSLISEIKEKNVDEKKKPFKCSECIECFGYKHVLARHIKLKQEKMKPYDCNSCNLLFSDEHDLNAHLNSVHECNKQKICSIVGVSSLKRLGSFKNRSEHVLKEVIDESKTINSGSHSIKVNESTALLPQQKRKSFSSNIQKPAKSARVLPPVLSL